MAKHLHLLAALSALMGKPLLDNGEPMPTTPRRPRGSYKQPPKPEWLQLRLIERATDKQVRKAEQRLATRRA